MNNSLSVYWLFEPNESKMGQNILTSFKESIIEMNLVPNIENIDCCCSAFEKMQPGKKYDIRVFKTKKHIGCYSEGIFNYICSSNSNDYGINIEILNERERSRIYDYKERKIILTSEQVMNKKLIKSIVRTFTDRPKVYISYGNDGRATSKLIRKLMYIIDKTIPFVEVKVDQEMEFRESVTDFMDDISSSDHVISLINKKYLQSEYCMQEYLGMIEKSNVELIDKNKIYPIVMPSGRVIYDEIKLVELTSYWKNKHGEIRSIIGSNPDMSSDLENRLNEKLSLYKNSEEAMLKINDTIGVFAASQLANHKANNYLNLVWSIYESFYQATDNSYFPLYHDKSELKSILKKIVASKF